MISSNPSIKDIQSQIEVLPNEIVATVKKYGRTYVQLTDPCLDDDKIISVGDYWMIGTPDEYTWGDAKDGTFQDFLNMHNAGTAAGYKDVYCWDGEKWVHVFDTAESGVSFARTSLTDSKLETEVYRRNALEGELKSRVSQTADKIETEVTRASAAEGLLKSTITQTASEIRSEVEAVDQGLNSKISQTASAIRSEVNDVNQSLSSSIAQTASQIRSEVNNVDQRLSTSITQTQNSITTEVSNRQNAFDTLTSRISQTDNTISTEIENRKQAVNGAVQTLTTRITQTENSIATEVTNRKEAVNGAVTTLSSRISQTENSIATEVANRKEAVNGAVTTLSSRISQTENSIATEVANRKEAVNGAVTTLSSRISQTENSITLAVSKISNGTTAVGKVATSTVDITSSGISLKTNGIFTVASGKFSIDKSGNVTMAGKITAYDDSDIAGWKLNNGWIWKQTNSAPGTTVALSPGESPYNPDKGYVFWAGAAWPERVPSVTTQRSGHAPVRISYGGSILCRYLGFLDQEKDDKGQWTGKYIKKWINLSALWEAYKSGQDVDGDDQAPA